MISPTYQVWIDWDGDGGLRLGEFEYGTDSWVPGGTVLPTVAQSTVRSYHGSASLLVTWGAAGTGPLVQRSWSGLTVGVSYALSAWVYVPAGSPAVRWTAAATNGTASAVTNAWTEITHTFTATATTHTLAVTPSTSPSAGNQVWIDHARITGPGEDVSGAGRVDDRTTIGIDYGRDQARSLSPIKPGESGLELDNTSKDYSPEYTSSPLAGYLGPGRELVIQGTYSDRAYTLYRGYTDNYNLKTPVGDGAVSFSALDGMARLKTTVSTALYGAIRTGDAIHRVLDAVGWTGGRDIDPGGTTLRWWCLESQDAFQAISDIVSAEGPSAVVHTDPSGGFIFRDRHHRLIRSASITSQATFRDTGADPLFDPPLEYDAGWRDIVNSVQFEVVDRRPKITPEVVWSMSGQAQISPGQSLQFTVKANGVFASLATPTQGTDPAGGFDFVLNGVGPLSFSFSPTSGQSTVMTVTCPLGGSTLTILSAQLRGYTLEDVGRSKVLVEDTTSIAANGRRSFGGSVPDIGVHDALAVATLIVGQRATRMPIVRMQVTNANATILAQQLGRDLSDRVTIVDSESGINADFYVEQISHEISETGLQLITTFGCEKARTVPSGLFRFDTSGAGFGQGAFGPSGLDVPTSVFRFDTTGQGFDQGLLAN
jgi:hypothetical protein